MYKNSRISHISLSLLAVALFIAATSMVAYADDGRGPGHGGGGPPFPPPSDNMTGGRSPFHPPSDNMTGGRPPFHPPSDNITGGRPPFHPPSDNMTGGRPPFHPPFPSDNVTGASSWDNGLAHFFRWLSSLF